MDIDIKGNLLIRYSALVRFLRENGSKIERCISCIKTTKSLCLGLYEDFVSRSAFTVQETDDTVLNTTNCKSILRKRLSFTSLLHVSTSTESSTGRDTQRHTSTAHYVKDGRF